MLFELPQREIFSLIQSKLQQCVSASILVGFATSEGVVSISQAIKAAPTKLKSFILGAGTLRGYESLDGLIALGVAPQNVQVHLGHTRDRPSGGFERYRPMMHSKIFLMDLPDGTSSAFVGSHNLTGFALKGRNGEAGVLLEGPSDDVEFQKIRNHITEAASQSIVYDPSMKKALAWWTTQFVDGLRREIGANDEDIENRRTFVIITASGTAKRPKKGETIYFEIPSGLPNITSLTSEVHIFVFDALPPTPDDALGQLHQAAYSLWCKTKGLELRKGGRELQAEWQISNRVAPMLTETTNPFRPRPGPDIQQVRVQVYRGVQGSFKYLFESQGQWKPIYDREQRLASHGSELGVPDIEGAPADHTWLLVRGLEKVSSYGRREKMEALKQVSPETGSFILLSSRRIDLKHRAIEEPELPDEE